MHVLRRCARPSITTGTVVYCSSCLLFCKIVCESIGHNFVVPAEFKSERQANLDVSDTPYIGAEGENPSRVAGGCRPPQRCCLPVHCCCCAQPQAARSCICLLFSLAIVPANNNGLLSAGLGIDFTYGQNLFHPTEPDIGDIDPMPVLLVVSQDKVVRSWQLCNLGRIPSATHACCTALLESTVLAPAHDDTEHAASYLCLGESGCSRRVGMHLQGK